MCTCSEDDIQLLFKFLHVGDLISFKKHMKNYVDVNMIRLNNYTLLDSAVFLGDFLFVEYLVSIGSDVNSLILVPPENYQTTPFSLACCLGYERIARFLYSHGADKNFKSDDIVTSLSLAVVNGHFNIVRYLISELNCNIDEPSSEYYRSALFFSIENGQYEIFEYLIANGADVNFCDIDKCTPLIFSCMPHYYNFQKN